jgi:hypothetical protein
MKMRQVNTSNFPQPQMMITPMIGGVNLVDPPRMMPNGHLLFASNYEVGVRGGYRRIDGYERYDGQVRPSQASYWRLDFDAGTDVPSVGDYIRGNSSGAVGILLAVTLSSGSWDGNDAAGSLFMWGVSGTFINNEILENLGGSGGGYDSGFANGFD